MFEIISVTSGFHSFVNDLQSFTRVFLTWQCWHGPHHSNTTTVRCIYTLDMFLHPIIVQGSLNRLAWEYLPSVFQEKLQEGCCGYWSNSKRVLLSTQRDFLKSIFNPLKHMKNLACSHDSFSQFPQNVHFTRKGFCHHPWMTWASTMQQW